MNLAREVTFAGGVAVTKFASESNEIRHSPLKTTLWECNMHVDLLQLRLTDQKLRKIVEHGNLLGPNNGTTQVVDNRDALIA